MVNKKCVNEGFVAAPSNERFYNPSLDLYMLPKKIYTMDAILLIGYLIQQEHYMEEEVVEYLLEENGIMISPPNVNNYKGIKSNINIKYY